MGIRVLGFDHVVVRCLDVEVTLGWYVRRLGLEPVRVDEWRAGHVPFPSVRVDATTIIDLLPGRADDLGQPAVADGRLDHVCLVTDAPSLDHVLADPAFDLIAGPVARFGAQGVATSVYVRDPDGLVVELRAYPD